MADPWQTYDQFTTNYIEKCEVIKEVAARTIGE